MSELEDAIVQARRDVEREAEQSQTVGWRQRHYDALARLERLVRLDQNAIIENLPHLRHYYDADAPEEYIFAVSLSAIEDEGEKIAAEIAEAVK